MNCHKMFSFQINCQPTCTLNNCLGSTNTFDDIKSNFVSLATEKGQIRLYDTLRSIQAQRQLLSSIIEIYSNSKIIAHAWSDNGIVLVVLTRTGIFVYACKFQQNPKLFWHIELFMEAKVIGVRNRPLQNTSTDGTPQQQGYNIFVGGSNGVEIYSVPAPSEIDGFSSGGPAAGMPISHEPIALLQSYPIVALAISPNTTSKDAKSNDDKCYLAIGALDGHLGIWCVSSAVEGNQAAEWSTVLPNSLGRVTSLAFSSGGLWLIVAGWGGQVLVYKRTDMGPHEQQFWSMHKAGSSKEPGVEGAAWVTPESDLAQLTLAVESLGTPTFVCFSPCQRRFALARSQCSSIEIYDLEGGILISSVGVVQDSQNLNDCRDGVLGMCTATGGVDGNGAMLWFLNTQGNLCSTVWPETNERTSCIDSAATANDTFPINDRTLLAQEPGSEDRDSYFSFGRPQPSKQTGESELCAGTCLVDSVFGRIILEIEDFFETGAYSSPALLSCTWYDPSSVKEHSQQHKAHRDSVEMSFLSVNVIKRCQASSFKGLISNRVESPNQEVPFCAVTPSLEMSLDYICINLGVVMYIYSRQKRIWKAIDASSPAVQIEIVEGNVLASLHLNGNLSLRQISFEETDDQPTNHTLFLHASNTRQMVLLNGHSPAFRLNAADDEAVISLLVLHDHEIGDSVCSSRSSKILTLQFDKENFALKNKRSRDISFPHQKVESSSFLLKQAFWNGKVLLFQEIVPETSGNDKLSSEHALKTAKFIQWHWWLCIPEFSLWKALNLDEKAQGNFFSFSMKSFLTLFSHDIREMQKIAVLN